MADFIRNDTGLDVYKFRLHIADGATVEIPEDMEPTKRAQLMREFTVVEPSKPELAPEPVVVEEPAPTPAPTPPVEPDFVGPPEPRTTKKKASRRIHRRSVSRSGE